MAPTQQKAAPKRNQRASQELEAHFGLSHFALS